MSNRLANETSPYLRQHAENPVDWYPWGEEAFRRARDEDKPIHLSWPLPRMCPSARAGMRSRGKSAPMSAETTRANPRSPAPRSL
ncbi:DUF255 domain-containing protein [Pseudomonas sp. H3(2019)]|uniref:DUF255 domain-containing protein n=1 Tax=Pseudomonas sp. H3(2019) TaxID=2598724 RepID=UPI001C49970D|nr:DUF255 domain-containing protein [Pseudomonas sp. H3(2019)]